MCGGTEYEKQTAVIKGGLSPRVRGNPGRYATDDLKTRSIPACAGEPPPSVLVAGWGEGLSPRVRGNPQLPM